MEQRNKVSENPSISPSLLPACQPFQHHEAHTLKEVNPLAQALPIQLHFCILNKLWKGLNFTEKGANISWKAHKLHLRCLYLFSTNINNKV